MLDLKQHIASLVAVFLALGIGIFIGTAVAGDGGLAQQQAALVQRLEDDYVALRVENKKFADEVLAWRKVAEQYKEYVAEVFPYVIQGKLEGLKLVVIVTGTFNSYAGVMEVLEKAGARIQGRIEVSSDWELTPAEWQQCLGEALPSDREPLAFLGSKIGEEVAKGNQQMLTVLATKGFLVSRVEAQEKPQAVLILGGSENKGQQRAKKLDLSLIRSLLTAGIRVIAAEASTVPFSDATLYQGVGIPVIAAADTIPGQTELIWVLAGDK